MAPTGSRTSVGRGVVGTLSRAFAGWQRPSVMALVAANLFPLSGVLLGGWTVFQVLLLYWLENVVVGGYSVLRMLVASPARLGQWAAKVLTIPFFALHYGAFSAIHGLFVIAVFGRGYVDAPEPPMPRFVSFGAIEFIAWMVKLIAYIGELIHRCHLEYALLALVASHGFSFVWNFIGKGEFRRVLPENLMARPYGRVVIMHLVIIFGAGLVALFGTPMAALVLLVVLKTVIDVVAHLREHKRMGTVPTENEADDETSGSDPVAGRRPS